MLKSHGVANDRRTLETRPLHLELGCGSSKRLPHAVGIDVLDLAGVDVVGDALEVLRALPAGSVTSVYSEHFLEHVADPLAILAECARVLRPGGLFRAVVPHFANPYFYSDPTHRVFFGLYTFDYWIRSSRFRRRVPHYADPLPFALVSARHQFKSPFYLHYAAVKALSFWVGLSRWTQELYEGHLCWLLPCYELDIILRRD